MKYVHPGSCRLVESAVDLPTERARTGDPVISLAGKRLHSYMDPRSEGRQIIEVKRAEIESYLRKHAQEDLKIILVAPGLGYVIDPLLRLLNEMRMDRSHVQVYCLEANASIARKAQEVRVWKTDDLHVRWVLLQAGDADAVMEGSPLILHCPTSRYHRSEYESLLSQLDQKCNPERPLRIMVPTPLYGGSYPIALHCADAFRELGYKVDLLDLSAYYPLYSGIESVSRDPRHRQSLRGILTTFLAEMITARALEWKADLLWALAQTPMIPSALQTLRRENIRSAFWFVEDYRLFDYWRQLCPHYDAVFTIQQGRFMQELRDIGVTKASYLPAAANPHTHYPQDLTSAERARFGSDVSFVGAGYRNRQLTFAQLNLEQLKIWGNDWPEQCAASKWIQESGRRVTTDETRKIFSTSAINLNLHSSTTHAGVNPSGDFVNPRTFEIAACNGFQLVDRRSELGALFNEGEEIIAFDNVEEIPRLVKYYLANPNERERVAGKGRERMLREHTYMHRMRSALEYLDIQFPRLKGRKRGHNYISSLMEAAGDDEELLAFLKKYDPDEEADLDTIVDQIELGKRRLNRPEGLFLLMKEFRDWGREKGVIS